MPRWSRGALPCTRRWCTLGIKCFFVDDGQAVLDPAIVVGTLEGIMFDVKFGDQSSVAMLEPHTRGRVASMCGRWAQHQRLPFGFPLPHGSLVLVARRLVLLERHNSWGLARGVVMLFNVVVFMLGKVILI